MVLMTGTGGHEQENRRARADRRIGAERAAQIEGLPCSEPCVENDDIGARRARPIEHGGFGEHAQHGVPASPERSDDVREGVVLIAGDEDPRRTGETRSNRHETWGVDEPNRIEYPAPIAGLRTAPCSRLPAPGSRLPALFSEGTLAPRRAYDHIQQEVSYGSPHHSAVAVVQAPGAVGGSEGLTRPGGPSRPA